MSVSYPKGVSRPQMMKPAPGIQAPVGAARVPSPTPATTGQVPGKGNFATAMTHHGHLGTALKAADAKTAMHHLGHILRSVKSSGTKQSAPSGAPKASAGAKAPPMAAPASAPIDPADGTEDTAQSTTASSGFNGRLFKAMKGK